MDTVLAVFLGIAIYTVICLVIAFARAVFSKPQNRKQNFVKTFLSFFLEILNPLYWLS